MNEPSETMDLDLTLRREALLHEELSDLFPVLALQLDDAAPGLVLDDGAVAVPLFFEVADQFLEIEVFGQALDDCDALPCSSLLELDVDHLLLSLRLIVAGLVASCYHIELILDHVCFHYFNCVDHRAFVYLVYYYNCIFVGIIYTKF